MNLQTNATSWKDEVAVGFAVADDHDDDNNN